jgi:manganese/zinc/iron transport system permease protein
VLALDLLLLGMVTSVTVIGLQSVGMLLVIALMVIPATAARCWTHNLKQMTILSALMGGMSATIGVAASALWPRLAAGAIIVLAGTALFGFSVLFGGRSGVITELVARIRRNRAIANDHLMRALFEIIEGRCGRLVDLVDQLPTHTVRAADLQERRSWSPAHIRKLVHQAHRNGLVVDYGDLGVKFTERGAIAAGRVVRNHRLWELYLIEYAARSPNRVDRDADDIEHFLGPEITARLERLVAERYPPPAVPPSPHAIADAQQPGASP